MDTSDITAMISAILLAHDSRRETRLWQGTALVAVSDADDPGFRELKTTVSPTHRLPEELVHPVRPECARKQRAGSALLAPLGRGLSEASRYSVASGSCHTCVLVWNPDLVYHVGA
jgi:hypothetical protein